MEEDREGYIRTEVSATLKNLNVEGGAHRRLETGQADSATPFWSSDGGWLYFTAVVEGANQIFKVATEGGRAT